MNHKVMVLDKPIQSELRNRLKVFERSPPVGEVVLYKMNKSKLDLHPFSELAKDIEHHLSITVKSKKVENWNDLQDTIGYIKDNYISVIISCKFYDKTYTINCNNDNFSEELHVSISLISEHIPHKRVHLVLIEKHNKFYVNIAPVVTTA